MPRGRPGSELSRQERLDRAFTYFRMGYSNADVSRRLRCHPDTSARYRRKYEEHLRSEVSENPGLISDVLGNTLRTLEEIDLVRKDAWHRLRAHSDHDCYECGCSLPMPVQSATQLHGTILKAQEQRIKLFGLLGVKQEYFIHVQNIQIIQNKILEFMASELCDSDRMRLNDFLDRELPALTERTGDELRLPILDVEGEEVAVPA